VTGARQVSRSRRLRPLLLIAAFAALIGAGWHWHGQSLPAPADAIAIARPGAEAPLPDSLAAVTAASTLSAMPPTTPLPAVDDAALSELIDQLDARARSGERAAACRLAAELDRCRRLPRLRRDAAFWEANAQRSDTLLEHAIDAVAQNEAAIAGLELHCRGISDDQLAGAWQHQLRAADLGDREAALRYLLDPPLPERALDDLPGWAEYARRFAPMLEALAAGGDANAGLLLLAQLSGADAGQSLITPEPYRAAVWAHALGELAAAGDAHFMLQMMIGTALADAEQALAPAELARARDAGTRLYRERLQGAAIDQALLAGEGLAMRDPGECDVAGN
jgi:hypothetical protein